MHHAIGPVPSPGELSSVALDPDGDIKRLKTDIAVFEGHISDLRAELLELCNEENRLAYLTRNSDETAAEDQTALETNQDRQQTARAEIAELEKAITGAKSEIESTLLRGAERVVIKSFERDRDTLKVYRQERLAILRDHLERASSDSDKAAIEARMENVEKEIILDYKLFRTDQKSRLHDINVSPSPRDIAETGDYIVGGLRIPVDQYRAMREKALNTLSPKLKNVVSSITDYTRIGR